MDWKQLIAVSQTELENEDKRDEIYEDLIFLNNYNAIDGKGYKKLFKLCQLILKHKGEQVTSLLTELDTLATRQGELEALGSVDKPQVQHYIEEIERLTNEVEKLEAEKFQFKTKIKELNEEMAFLQRKQNGGHQTESDRDDSPDALSEIDKQQELLNNISIKNKHIKRLLKDIEVLEQQIADQMEVIIDLKTNLNQATLHMTELTSLYGESQAVVSEKQAIIDTLNAKVVDLEEQIENFDQAGINREKEIEKFARELEERAVIWKTILDNKQTELEALSVKYNDLLEEKPGYDIDSERYEIKRLNDVVQERDGIIQELELKMIEMSRELINSTNTMNRIAEVKENFKRNANVKDPNCCNNLKELLAKSNERCKDLQDMISTIEDDNILKSKQALEALEALKAYESGQDGLSAALQKIHTLEQKVNARDKQIRQLIVEVNAAHEITLENTLLRKKLGIPNDEFIATGSVSAKYRKIEKLNDRLTLKLRASEEMRLQLKLEKADLKRQMLAIKSRETEHIVREHGDGVNHTVYNVMNSLDSKCCENCAAQYELTNDMKYCESCLGKQNCNLCAKCRTKLKVTFNYPTNDEYKKTIIELEDKYRMVVEENENLRIGMHEILAKIREYDAESDHITIDSETLEKLLHALDARSISGWYHPAMRIQNELIATKEREHLLRERVRISDSILTSSYLTKTEPKELIKDTDTEVHETEDRTELDMTDKKSLDTEVKEGHENQSLNNETILAMENNLNLLTIENEDLRTVKSNYDELMATMSKSDDEKLSKLAALTKELVAKNLEILANERKIDYLKLDLDSLSKSLKDAKFECNEIKSNYKKDLIGKTNKILELQEMLKNFKDDKQMRCNQRVETLENELKSLKLTLNIMTKNFYQKFTEINSENGNLLKLNEMDFGRIEVIVDEKTIDFVTKSELDQLQVNLSKSKNEIENLKIKNKQYEDLVRVTDEQLFAQQQIISKYSDDEISIRHLVADLQSSSNEKYLIAKTQRELENLREREKYLERKIEKYEKDMNELRCKVSEITHEKNAEIDEIMLCNKNNDLKIEYLTKLLQHFSKNYNRFTPLFPLMDFIRLYSDLIQTKISLNESYNEGINLEFDTKFKEIHDKLSASFSGDLNQIENKIEIVKYQNKCEFLVRQMKQHEKQINELQSEIGDLKLKEVNLTEICSALELLFTDDSDDVMYCNQFVQASVVTMDRSTMTEICDLDKEIIFNSSTQMQQQDSSLEVTFQNTNALLNQKSLESQLKQAMTLASTRTALLLETETRLAEAQGRIKAIEKNLEDKDKLIKSQREKLNRDDQQTKDENVFSSTINSLQKLLLEKDTTLSRYQELLKAERDEKNKNGEETRKEVKSLKDEIYKLERNLADKEREIGILQTRKVETASQEKGTQTDVPQVVQPPKVSPKQTKLDVELPLTISDTFIEVMFKEDKNDYEFEESQLQLLNMKRSLKESEDEIRRLQIQLRDLSNREKIWDKNLNEQTEEINRLNERLKQQDTKMEQVHREIPLGINSKELEQLREMLEEKDRHIQELTETLTHFHDDQQKFLNDTTMYSAEQVAQLSADLTRCEATNRVYSTQIEALKRQITNLSQREKQARELVKTLKNQLIRRPVISVKSERVTNSREDQLYKKVGHLETELAETKEELKKQATLAESRRNKNAADLDLWNKQKHWQQLAEKLKMRIKEKESDIEKLRSSLSIAKNSIQRLEKEKQLLESRTRSARYCTASSCPNTHLQKYTPAESPESCVTHSEGDTERQQKKDYLEHHPEMIETLKTRIEAQQRKIVAMELEGRGANAQTKEIEKLQDKVSSLEAQNTRLEARNLQLQLDNEMLRQADDGERVKRQVKHLEEYVVVLKDELAQALSINSMASHVPSNSSSGKMEQTILAMRNIIEKLRVENKNLKESKNASMCRNIVPKEMYEKLQIDFEKLQKHYSEALDKISSLQIDSGIRNGGNTNRHTNGASGGDFTNELRMVKDKLIQKTELLEKAKILLTRAAAKEKNMREQIDILKRRCSELQNVPVIDETSETEVV